MRLQIREIKKIRGQRLVLTLVRISEIKKIRGQRLMLTLVRISEIKKIRGQRLVLTLVRISEILLVARLDADLSSFPILSKEGIGKLRLIARGTTCKY